jgi:superfamily I DNA/RNA helicase
LVTAATINFGAKDGHNLSLAEDNLQTALEEERRLLYVGMTRAKRLLILAHFDVGRFMSYSRSRFLREIV